MKSVFDNATYDEVIKRIHRLSENSQREWGKMSVSQMFSHCKEPLNVALGKKTLKKPNFIMKLIFKSFKSSLYNDTPWQKNLPTAKEYKIEDEKDFETEKHELIVLITEFHNKKEQTKWPNHPACGDFTRQQWGQMQYKHLDHHLRQFGV